MQAVYRTRFLADLGCYLTYYDADLEYSMPGGLHGHGLKGVPEALQMQLTALPDSRVAIRQIVVQGETAVVEGSVQAPTRRRSPCRAGRHCHPPGKANGAWSCRGHKAPRWTCGRIR